ncbi:MAG: helix-turn-helix transcriptional regulator [Lachnospiraceae bacterium]|nr:helix-turn-helix transcriptional regulator [Lachnospiraceae bacterium]
MYSVFADLCKALNVKPADVARATGIATSTLTNWKKGKYVPKQDKLQKIADFFGVSLEYLMTGQQPEHESTTGEKYYFSDETAQMAQELFDDPDLRILFDAARDSKPEDLRMAAEMLKKFKATNPDG